MRQTTSNAAPTRRISHRRYSFRAFYLTVALISTFTILSLVADQFARYRHGAQYGVAQKRALADVTRLFKRDEEVHYKTQFLSK
jgi:solute carrier family 24 (sodium/potassium/calcium exchanger), member 6